MRKINVATKWTNTEVKEAARIFTFRTQNLMDLFINEMEGQISDGQWENSRGTEWMWRGKTVYLLGKVTKVLITTACPERYKARKRNFYMTKDLCDVIGERATEEAGFETIKDMKAGWLELANAIHDAVDLQYNDAENVIYVETPRRNSASLKETLTRNFKEELDKCTYIHKDRVGLSCNVVDEEGKRQYWIDARIYIDEVNPEKSGIKLSSSEWYKNEHPLSFTKVVPINKIDETIKMVLELDKEVTAKFKAAF